MKKVVNRGWTQIIGFAMKVHVTSVLAGFVIHTALILAAPSPSKELLPALRGKRSFVRRDGVDRTVFEREATGSTIDFVTNSGICETTPGVNQYSGYFSMGSAYSLNPVNSPYHLWLSYTDNISYSWWFFAARRSPKYAPLAAWFNGGSGCSSMIGLFQVCIFPESKI